MKLEQVSEHCYAALPEKNRLGDANSGLINHGGGVVIDTQFDLAHARRMVELFQDVWDGRPQRVVNTHEDADHVWGNQLFKGAEIWAHCTVPDRMRETADPKKIRKLTRAARSFLLRAILRWKNPGLAALGRQLIEDYDFQHIVPTFPNRTFESQHDFDLNGLRARLLYVGPGHQTGDTVVHVPEEKVVYAGDVLFRNCTPMGWSGTFENWTDALDRIISWSPQAIVPGHGPVTDIAGAREMKRYLQFVLAEARIHFDRGRSSSDAAQRIDPGPFARWSVPSRLWVNVERAYRQFRGERSDAAWSHEHIFDSMLALARTKGFPIEF